METIRRALPAKGLHLLQLNLGRARAAHDLEWAEAMKNEVDLIIISEPN